MEHKENDRVFTEEERQRVIELIARAEQEFRMKNVTHAQSDITTILTEVRAEENYSWDDKGNGKLFADIFREKCRYNVTAKEWYVYNGKNWEEDTEGMEVSK